VRRWIVCAALGVAVAGCSERSASIEAVASWSLSATPRVAIGVADGDERYTFSRIVGATLLRDRGVLVADGLPSIALYDSAGVFVRRFGRKGSGPGEYELFWHPPFPYRGDSIATWDMGQRRVSVLGPTGAYGRSAKLVIGSVRAPGTIPSQSCCRVLHALAEGAFVLEFPAAIPNEPGPNRRSTVTLATIAPDGGPRDTIGAFAAELYRYDPTATNRIRELRLSGRFTYDVAGDTVFAGNGDGPWFLRIVPGSRPDTVRFSHAAVPVTPELKEQYASAWRAEFARNPQRFEGAVERLFEGEYVSHLPTYTHLFHDPVGALWMRQWAMPFSGDSGLFNVYSTQGRQLARIAIPSTGWIADIRNDRVALIETDSLGVQYVRVYDIIRALRD